jgi:tRNA (guanine37-N1)-methyltransferase
MFNALILTLFPEMFPGPLGHSLAGKALKNNIWQIESLQIRDFAIDKHQNVDDTAYGGGTGLIMRADVLGPAIEAAKKQLPDATLIYPTPKGETFSQPMASELIQGDIIILCGRYEAIDQRIIEYYQPLEISMGDFILSGGEVAALTMLDACVRLLPGVIGDEEAIKQESFGLAHDYTRLLEYPQYTRPPVWQGLEVPEILLSGNHAAIDAWRKSEAEAITKARRPELWKQYKAGS